MIPGNGSVTSSPRIINLTGVSVTTDDVSKQAIQHNVTMVVVGPEVPLVDGLADGLRSKGISCFGPSAKAAHIEGSKCFSKDFMSRHNIPTAEYRSFTVFDEAADYVRKVAHPVVLKASGCAAGKGVLIPTTKEEAIDGLRRIMVDREFGSAGDEVVVEQFIDGDEVSVMCFTDGYSVVVMPPAQDHKRAFDGDKGPNTGGMGAYAPAPFVSSRTQPTATSCCFGPKIDEIVKRVLKPTVDGMRREGRPFVGVLFAGLIIDKQGGIYVLEFNCRLGDPETQVVLPLLDSDLFELFQACVETRLDSVQVTWKDGYAVTVVAASQGYPDAYPKGKVITGYNSTNFLNNNNNNNGTQQQQQQLYIFHAGTSLQGDQLVTSGGRVLSVTATSLDLEQAIAHANQGIKQVTFEGCHSRSDIGHRAVKFLEAKRQQKSGGVSYSESGVDIERGDAVVDGIAPLAKSTNRKGCVSDLGGFGALFDCKAAGFVDPILVSGTDGVGTKLKIAQEINRHQDIGIDLVAMCVNDVLVQGAEPLFFLDYFATGRIHVDVATKVIGGIARGCKESGCALIGGETAEMPGMYRDGEYDLAGFSVGAVERTQMLPRNIREGNVLLGLASSGVHSNGYSLVRYLVEKKSGLEPVNDASNPNAPASVYHHKAPFDAQGRTLGEVLLAPTRLYVLSCLAAIKQGGVNGLAHITGGGITENLPRVLPDGLDALVSLDSWTLPPVFKWLNEIGQMEQLELLRTFNCGIGMILIVEADQVDAITSTLKAHNETSVFKIGQLIRSTTPSKPKVVYQ
uniref:Phosphoribosylformylglycinamidine cyclo-ligase n=1 Tax=Cavenderia deminutiva TaxID=361123 RepID=A0A1L2FUT1_9MYCE|nr:phosphoribosylamine-glycine ligase/phosphoribosylformylglycinamide cyclo-ligase [Cavenderia deminutiva]